MMYLLLLPLSRRVNMVGAVTTSGPSIDQEDNDNITKTPTMAEARPKAPSSSKDSISVDEDRLKLQNLELTARVALLEAGVSKLRHQGEKSSEDDYDSLEAWFKVQEEFQRTLFQPADVQIYELKGNSDEEEEVMMDFLKARGESRKRLGPMNFINLQALYRQVKKEEEERLKNKRASTTAEERKLKKPKTESLVHPPSIQQITSPSPRLSSSTPKESKSSHPAPSHLQPPKKKTKPPTTFEESRKIVQWFNSDPDQWYEVFRGEVEKKRSIYRSVDEVMQLLDSDLPKILELGEAHEPDNESERHLLLIIKHYFNPSKDVFINSKPLQSHFPLVKWSYNAVNDEYTLVDIQGYKMRCSSKAIFSMTSKDIKSLF
ncbi:hypothetical protein L1987_59964 [Smallanthus sonchifolius]|uniref:Uncharacterized protein n=1 Tax=Smallanthus sonchifolius TaxID=185202 RepID=A0ACB9D6R6_9ASTR|nr:hypothetical protein L1987_59964 [Smallanthus sonchifolius]